MNSPYFEMTVPVFTKNLTNLKVLLEKGLAHASELGMSEADLLQCKLAPDMYPLIKQVQIATDNAKGAVARLAGVEPLKLADTETTVAELVVRIDTVIAHLATFTAEQFEGAAERQITLPFMPGLYLVGNDYLKEFALANFFFHVNMAYAILRMTGVSLTKTDYIGGMTVHPVV